MLVIENGERTRKKDFHKGLWICVRNIIENCLHCIIKLLPCRKLSLYLNWWGLDVHAALASDLNMLIPLWNMCNATCTSSHISQKQSIVLLFVMPVKYVSFASTNNKYIPGQTNINFDLFFSLSLFISSSFSFFFAFHMWSVCDLFFIWNLQSKAFFLTPELAFCCQLMNAAITSKEKPTLYANAIPSSSSKNFCYSISVETTTTSTATAVSSMLIIDTMSFCCSWWWWWWCWCCCYVHFEIHRTFAVHEYRVV